MRIVILGGNGFIGSHVVDACVRGGLTVRVFDRAGSLRHPAVPGVEYLSADFSDIASLCEALVDVDIVVHLISTTVPSTSIADPVGDVQGNLIGTLRLIEQMQRIGLRRLIFISSGGTVYGNPRVIPVTEDQPRNPLSPYGVVKVAIENYLEMYTQLYDFRVTVLRVSNPFGPRQGHIGVQGVVPTFCHRIRNHEIIKIWGDGCAVRDYIYIDDLIDALMRAIQKEVTGVYNIGTGYGTSLNELLRVIATISGIKPVVEYLPPRSFDVRDIVLNVAKARMALEWTPKTDVQAGCERYWKWLNGSK